MVRHRLLPVLLAVVLGGCFLVKSSSTPGSNGGGANGLVTQLDQRRDAAKTGEPQAVVDYAVYLAAILSSPDSKHAHGEIDWDARIAQSLEFLDVIGVTTKDEGVRLQVGGAQAQLLIAAGRAEEALAPVHELYEASPSLMSTLLVLEVHRRAAVPMDDSDAFCAENRPLAQSDEDVHALLGLCASMQATSVESLAWASDEDKATWLRVQESIEAANVARAEAEERRREEERLAAEQQPATSSSPSTDAGPSGPVIVSVTLKNECSETVKLFFGDKPKFGSGRYSSIGSNTRTSRQMQEGDMVRIVDDSQNGVASHTVTSASRELRIGSDCSSFR